MQSIHNNAGYINQQQTNEIQQLQPLVTQNIPSFQQEIKELKPIHYLQQTNTNIGKPLQNIQIKDHKTDKINITMGSNVVNKLPKFNKVDELMKNPKLLDDNSIRNSKYIF